MKRIALFAAIISLFLSCKNSSVETTHQSSPQTDNIFKYAKNVYSQPGSNSVTVYFSWGDSIVYCLDSLANASNSSSSHLQYFLQSANSIATISTTDIAMLAEMNETERISGVCDPFRISNNSVRKRVEQGHIKNIGTSMEINMESLLALNPDIVITSAYSKADFQNNDILEKLNIPVIYNMGWQENSPLGKVEWIKFIGMLIGEYEKADSIFSEIEKKYLETKALASSVKNRPSVLAGSAYNEIWYMPGGQSYVATFIADAGGDYLWKDDDNTGSVMVNFEQVLQASQNADVWIGSDETTFESLAATNKNYALLHPFKTKDVFHRAKRTNAEGGNDYWEYGYVRPDLIIKDYLKIIHPELLPDYEMIFMDKVRE
ncbi:MAG: ABC transporter substrate-binding protein [Bacteroidales bacterium]|nr:ABC transporter substrate-binding protein [Bacteroidales bacterium]